MATIFLEPGGDADFGTGLWTTISGAPTIVTDFVHGGHVKSLKFQANAAALVKTATGTLADAGSRLSWYLYLVALPGATATIFSAKQSDGATNTFTLRMTSGGVLQVWNGTSGQIGSNGATLGTGAWNRISIAYTITNGTTNTIKVFVNGTLSITVTNATITNITTSIANWGNISSNSALDQRTSDFYIDNSSALTDPATDIWVTAKRPFANGTTNGFTTQIGSGGSGYGSGHAPQVNERPNNDANGWSVIGAGSAVTEEYNIEASNAGDINISAATIIDYMGWIRTKALAAETGKIIVNNVQTSISITTSISFFTQIAGSSTYPAGTGTDIGEVTSTTVTTVSLYECGVVVAYTPSASAQYYSSLTTLGVG